MGKIIAIVGLCGAGKSEAVKFFVEKGYKRVYFGDPVFDEMKRQKLEVNEKNERKVREELREKYGMAAMAVLSLEKIKEFMKTDNVVVESLYSWQEFKVLDEIYHDSFKLLAIYTTKALRYERLKKRQYRPLTEEESINRDIRQIEKTEQGGPIAFADFTVLNDGSMQELKKKLERYT